MARTPYTLTDKTLDHLVKIIVTGFQLAKIRLTFDELNIVKVKKESDELWNYLAGEIRADMSRLAETVIRRYKRTDTPMPRTDDLIDEILVEYNPVTKYVFVNEFNRRKARFLESMISSEPLGGEEISSEVDSAAKSIARMTKQLADDVTFDALLAAYAASGYQYVEWITHPDDRRCKTCKGMHGNVYRIDKVPPKPHPKCRCYVRGVKHT